MQTKLSFNVIGPGGTAYFFRRTRGLPKQGIALPPRIPASVPVDPMRCETGYITRRNKVIWGEAKFDAVRNQWCFVEHPAFAEIAPNQPRPGPPARYRRGRSRPAVTVPAARTVTTPIG